MDHRSEHSSHLLIDLTSGVLLLLVSELPGAYCVRAYIAATAMAHRRGMCGSS